MTKEKREYSRIEITYPVSISTTDGVIHGALKNISLGGGLVLCKRLPRADESFDLLIELPPEYAFPVSATAKKVRLHSQDNDVASLSYELAFRFTDISEENFKGLCNALESEARLRHRRQKAITSAPSGVKKSVIRSMKKLSRVLKRSFSDLFQEAMEDLVRKYEMESEQIPPKKAANY